MPVIVWPDATSIGNAPSWTSLSTRSRSGFSSKNGTVSGASAGGGVSSSMPGSRAGRGVPVMGHVGLRPQSVLLDGAFKARGRHGAEYACVIAEAKSAADAGAFCVVVEGVAEALAREITAAIPVPTIGIGASAGCDGQILVTDDMLGLFDWTPKFVRRYADLRGEITRAVAGYAEDVRTRRFPGPAEIYFAKAG